MLKPNPKGDYPIIHETAFVDETAIIVGNVRIGANTFVGPLAVIRADESESCVAIGKNSNVQDHVIIHAHAGTSAEIGESVSLAHGCVVHGPCLVARDCFIGFNAVIHTAELGEGVFVGHSSTIATTSIPKGKKIPHASLVDTLEAADELPDTSVKEKKLAEKIVQANHVLVSGYRVLEGNPRESS